MNCMNFITKSIPNFITLLNLTSGCYGVVAAINNDLTTTFYCMLFSLLFDFCDGFAARALKAYSPMGKELDSLADMVSFGVAPSLVLYSLGIKEVAFVVAAFSALRLAKFNIDTRQSDSFIGLATPANAIFFGAIGYLSETGSCINPYLTNTYLIIAAIVMSLMLVVELPMFALKFKSFAIQKNRLIYSFILLSAVALIFLGVLAIPLIVIAYILVSVIQLIIRKR